VIVELDDGVDTSLLRGFAAGDDDAFEEVVRRFSGPMLSVAVATLGQRELALDAVQQALLAAWRASASFSPDAELAPWLCTITRRCAIDLWRRERRHRGSSLDAVPEVASETGPSYESVWETWQVREAVERLPPDERDVLRLQYAEGLTHPEVAKRLGIPVGTVKSRTHRAVNRLRAGLAHLALDPSGGARG
jgi:RNA polymerase sigma-70 factor (ECF subfamily)